MEEEEPGFGPDLAIFQILCRQMLVGQRGIVRGVYGAGERRCHWNERHHRAEWTVEENLQWRHMVRGGEVTAGSLLLYLEHRWLLEVFVGAYSLRR